MDHVLHSCEWNQDWLSLETQGGVSISCAGQRDDRNELVAVSDDPDLVVHRHELDLGRNISIRSKGRA